MIPKLISLQSRGNVIVRVIEIARGVFWVQKKMMFKGPSGHVYSCETHRAVSGKRRFSLRDALKLASEWTEIAAS